MKKTLVLAAVFCGFCGMSMAKTVELTTEQISDPSLISYFNFETQKTDTKTGITWNNSLGWTEGNGYATVVTNGDGLWTSNTTLGKSFTVSFDVKNLTTTSTANTLLTLTTSSSAGAAWRTAKVYTDNDNYLCATFGNGTIVSTFKTTDYTDWNTVTLTASTDTANNNTVTLVLYVDGEARGTTKVAGASNWVQDETVKMQLGYFGGAANTASMSVDNLLIYNETLTAAEVRSIATPEPATATLSLLALAGLAARRRRH